MTGSEKFWIIVSTVVLVYLNYVMLNSFSIENNEVFSHVGSYKTGIFITLLALEILIILFGLITLIWDDGGLLDQFNKYLDEKF